MGNTTAARKEAIRNNQNELLYQGVRFSVAGSLVAACVAVFVFGPLAPSSATVWVWFTIIVCVYIARAIDCQLFKHSADRDRHVGQWARRFCIGAIASSASWSASMWMIYPEGNLAHQVLLVLTLGGVAGGALASLPYDTRLSNTFQLLILTSVLSRLLLYPSHFSLELALFSCFVFGFLLSCGREVGKNYLDLLRLRQDSQETNLTLIHTSEQMARLGYWQWDLQSKTIDLSRHLSHMLGVGSQQVEIRHCFAMTHPDDRSRVEQVCARVMETGEDGDVEFRLEQARSGQYRIVRQVLKLISDSEGVDSLIGAVQDITDRKSAEQKIYSMAYYDELTGLANRAHFHERLDAEIEVAGRRNEQFAVVYIDLDDFKGVNDSYGHECGDNYLKHFASHLTSITNRSDLPARLGGDEFCILLRDVNDRQCVEELANRCLDYCMQVVQLGNHRVHPRMSIGIALFPDDGIVTDDLVKNADMAMYTVKQKGKHSYIFYTSQMATDNHERVLLEADLRDALQNDQFELWYQPKIDLQTNRMMGVEALIRWRHPTKGMIPPDVFITTAERVGMITEIGRWVFRSACSQLRQWNQAGIELNMAVNISGDHFVDDGFREFVFTTIEECHLAYGDVEIEITESLSRNPAEHSLICHDLREKGVRIAIDDFGTGYSSLSVLGNLEVDTLKIDKSFIDEIANDPAAHLMVRSITDLANGLGYDVVAEGVETIEQLHILRDCNCPYIQGYLFSRPVEATTIPILYMNENPLQQAA